MQWTAYQKTLHERAKFFCATRERADRGLLRTLRRIEKQARLGYADLFLYLRDGLGMNKHAAYDFKAVAERAAVVPALDRVLLEGRMSINRASRMLPILNVENADYLIEYALTHTEDELVMEVARLNPNPRRRTVVKPASGEHYRYSTDLSVKTFEMLRRARTLLGFKEDDSILAHVLEDYLERRDPVRKADRAASRKTKPSPDAPSPPTSPAGRTPLTAAETHAINHRDRGQCTFVTMDGKRCPNQRWLHKHHLETVAEGGSNDPNNLTTLCAYHHALVHQLTAPGLIRDG